jgi:hypothetical protein
MCGKSKHGGGAIMKRLLLSVFLFAASTFAQNISGSLSGTVQDSSGAALAGADLKLANTETSFLRTTKTNMEGFFSFPDLIPGSYNLEITATGFKQYRQEKIEISSAVSRSLEAIKMELGTVTQSVTVEAQSVAVMAASAERAGVINDQVMETMALRGRDFMDVVGLLPGVTDTAAERNGPNPNSMQNLFIAGGRDNTKNVTIDGVTNMDTGANNATHNQPSMDSIAEIKVLITNYGAEFGRNSGGAITIITRGGQRQFHGSFGWYHRNEDMNANSWLNNRQGLQRPLYRYNTFSYTMGGPVLVPKTGFNRDRNKLFFFYSQEFQRQLQPFTAQTVRVPTALERAGDFSQSRDVNGAVITVRDPLVGNTPGTQFPGNVVPPTRQTAAGQAILKMFPMPNYVDPNPANLYQYNFIAQISAPYPRHTEIIRGDYSPRTNLQMYVRLANNADLQTQPMRGGGTQWVNGSVNFPLDPILFARDGRGATAHFTDTVSSTMFNEFTFGVSENHLHFDVQDPNLVDRTKLGINIPQWYPASNPAHYIPNMTFSSVPNYANPSMYNTTPYYNSNAIYSFVDNLTKVWHSHNLKAGVYVERTRKDEAPNVAIRGAISFNRDQNVNFLDTNYAYATALCGYYDNYTEASARIQGQSRFTNLEWYLKDEWRVTPRLSLDYGLRFYHDMAKYDARHQIASFVPSLYNAQLAGVLLWPGYNAANQKVAIDRRTGAIYSQGLIGTFAPGTGTTWTGMGLEGKTLPLGGYTLPPVSLAPRFGFAWDPVGRGKTSVRGGIGVFFDRISSGPGAGNPPTIVSPTVYYGTVASLTDAAGQGVIGVTNVGSWLGEGRLPTVYNFSLGIQQQLNRNTVMDVSYVGSLGRHLLWQRNINHVPVGAQFLDLNPQNKDPTTSNSALANNFLRPIQAYGDITLNEFASTYNYNSLQVSGTRRMTRGSNVSFSYTFSKALGTASSDSDSVNIFGIDPRHYDYGPLSYDRTHNFTARYSYLLPNVPGKLGWRPLKAVANGWQISGITRMQSGATFTPGWTFQTGTTNMTGTTQNAVINVVNPKADPLNGRFGPPARMTFGTAGVGIMRLPGMNNWDLSLFRNIKVRERLKMQLRWETYNTFNHTQFSNVSQTAHFRSATDWTQIDPLFLTPTAVLPARRMQVALRLDF